MRFSLLRSLMLDLMALVWPVACVGCGIRDRSCCLACAAEIRRPRELHVHDLGFPCISHSVYAGPTRAMLIAFKHQERLEFRRELGGQLGRTLVPLLAAWEGQDAPVLVTAPSRAARTRQRGYAPVDLLLKTALRGNHVPVLKLRALRATRGRSGQVGLTARGREENASRVSVRAPARNVLRGRSVVLIDDITTTGATLRAAAAALEKVGADVVAAVVLCRATHENSPSAEPEMTVR